MPRLSRLLFASALLLGSASAHAQYSWIGPNGVRHFSDRPPPAGTPPGKILKAPRHAITAPVAIPDESRARPTPTLAAREAAYRGRAKERAEGEKKEAAEALRKRELAERCETARQVKAHSESDMRVSKIGANGERGFLTDEEKTANAARANKVLADCP